MKITDVRIRLITHEKVKAVASITIDGVFTVHDIKLINGENGQFIAMPSAKNAEGEFKDVAHPLNSETRSMLQRIIEEKYEKVKAADERAKEA